MKALGLRLVPVLLVCLLLCGTAPVALGASEASAENVLLYGKKQYRGTPAELKIGEYTPKDIRKMTGCIGGFTKIASLRIPEGLRVKLCRCEKRGGGYLGLEEDQEDLTRSGWFYNIVKIVVEASAEDEPPVKNYNYVLGTQIFAPLYGFRNEPVKWSYEGAQEIYKMGSNVLKTFGPTGEIYAEDRRFMDFREVLADFDFTYIYLWVDSGPYWQGPYWASEKERVYNDMYAFAKNLLTDYNDTGKTFYIGHWEGDWYLLGGFDTSKKKVGDDNIQGMAEWLNVRQQAIEDAKRDTPHTNVHVWGYAEANRTTDIANGSERVVNTVLPQTSVDYLSYSAYDLQGLSGEEIKTHIGYMDGMIPAKAGVLNRGKRVFVSEMAFSAEAFGYNQKKHNDKNIEAFIKFFNAGVSQILYWEMYSNEAQKDKNLGFWLIDDQGQKWQLYYSFKAFYCNAKEYVRETIAANGEAPDSAAFNPWASAFLETLKPGFWLQAVDFLQQAGYYLIHPWLWW